MTFLELALERNPQLNGEEITTDFCPEDMGLEDGSPCWSPDPHNGYTGYGSSCADCWNREVPDV